MADELEFEEGGQPDESFDGDMSPEAAALAVEAPQPDRLEQEGGEEGEREAPAPRGKRGGAPITKEMYDSVVQERDGFRRTVDELRGTQRQFAERMGPILKDWDRRRKIEAELDTILADAKVPPFEEDPAGHLDGRIRRGMSETVRPLAERLDSVAGVLEEQRQERERQAYERAIAEDIEMAKREAPDFDDAMQYLSQTRYNQLRQLYPWATDEQILGEIRSFSDTRARQWIQQGISPAKGLYQDAKSFGWNGAAGRTPARSGAPARRSGALADRRQAAGARLSTGRGAAASSASGKRELADMTPEDVLSMSPTEYARFREEFGLDGVLTLFGNEE